MKPIYKTVIKTMYTVLHTFQKLCIIIIIVVFIVIIIIISMCGYNEIA